MILAAGEGTRLRPLTLETPKVLLLIGGRPLIEHQLFWLKSHGIQEVAINLHHLGHKIKDYLSDGSRFGMKIYYSPEEMLLGTAGGVKRMERFFDSTFAIIYGDVLTNFDLSAMIQFHRQKNALATLALFHLPAQETLSTQRTQQSPILEVGVVEMDKEGRILSLVEKPQSLVSGPQPPTLASGGVYVLEKQVLDYIPDQSFSDFAYDIFPKLIELGLPIYGYLLKPEDYLIDIGTIEKYHKANEDIERFKVY